MDSLLSTKPQPYRELIWRSLILYRLTLRKIAFIALLLSIIIFIPRLLEDLVGQSIVNTLTVFNIQRLWIWVIDIFSLFFFITIMWHLFCELHHKHEPLKEDFIVGTQKVVRAFFAAVLQTLIIFIFCLMVYGCLLLLHHLQLLFINSLLGIIVTTCIFLGQLILLLYISTLFVFIIPSIVIENKSIIAAIKNSVSLVWDHWFRVFITQITPWVCYTLLLVLLKYAINLDIHIYLTHPTDVGIWTTLLNIVIFAIFIPWVAALLVIQLRDLELRKKLVSQQRSKHKRK